jgi:hypothetical protein
MNNQISHQNDPTKTRSEAESIDFISARLGSKWGLIKVLLLTLFISGLTLQSCKDEDILADPLTGEKYQQLNQGMRKLWSDHMHWTLATVDAFFHNSEALDANLTRLLQNQQDIGTAIVPYYGQTAGDQLAALLTEHIELAVPVLQAAQNNDQAALQTAISNWNQNAEDIANFLTAANPDHWPQAATEPALSHHIEHTIDYSVKILNEDYAGVNSSFEHALNHMLELADILSEGIAKQFPNKF